MALATRCPHCQTAFKVANDQLKLHAGLVRCGSCQQTFNAVENLIPADGQKPAATNAVAANTATVAPVSASVPAPVNAPASISATLSAALSATPPTAVATAPKPVAVGSERVLATELAKEPAPPAPVQSPVPAVDTTEISSSAFAITAPDVKAIAEAVLEAEVAAAPEPVKPPATAKPISNTKAATPNGKQGEEVLAAISKAEKEFEAENLDKPRVRPNVASPLPAALVATAATTTATAAPPQPPAGKEQTAAIKPEIKAAPAQETKAEHQPVVKPAEPVSSSALDFDMGDGAYLLPAEENNDTNLARVELETRAALMDPPAAEWSVSELPDGDLEKKPAGAASFPATQLLTPDSVSKVWRHKDHGETPALEHADSISDDVAAEKDSKPYIGEEEAALAQAAVSDEANSHSEEEPKPSFVIQAEKQRSRKRITTIMLSLMIAILLPLLLAQSAYILRNQLAARVPQSKPYLVQACQVLKCQISLPAQIEKIVVDSNELQNLAPERNIFMLVMQIQNQSDVVQAWPHIELVLNDVKEKPLLLRAFKPEEYLIEKDKLPKGFAAGGEQNIKLYFELPAIKAAGFHVGVFYP